MHQVIRLSEFTLVLREFAVKNDIDLNDASLFEATATAVAEAMLDEGMPLSKATKLFIESIHDIDTHTIKVLSKNKTLREVYLKM